MSTKGLRGALWLNWNSWSITFLCLYGVPPHKLELSIIDLIKDKGIGATVIGIVEKGVDPIYRFYNGSAKRR